MERLAEETELSNHLWVPSDAGDLIVINSVSSSQNYGVTVQVGYRTPVFSTSVGACFLSELDVDAQRIELLKTIAPNQSTSDLHAFSDHAAECRQYGFVSLGSPESQAINEISTPIAHGAGKMVIAALTIPHFANVMIDNRRDMVVNALRTTASQLQESIATHMPLPRTPWYQFT